PVPCIPPRPPTLPHTTLFPYTTLFRSELKVGDPVVITLPDNSTTPGNVSSVGTVATTPSSDQGGGSNTPTIEVDIAPSDPAATGDRKSTRLNSSHQIISYAVFCLKTKK